MNDLIVQSLEKRVLYPKSITTQTDGSSTVWLCIVGHYSIRRNSNIFLFFAIQLKYKWTTNTKIYSINFIHISSIFKLNKIKWLKTDELLKIYTIYAVTIHNFI